MLAGVVIAGDGVASALTEADPESEYIERFPRKEAN
jgi:hypothetical protein